MEPKWWASLDRFWLNWWYIFKELKNIIANTYECGDPPPPPPPKNSITIWWIFCPKICFYHKFVFQKIVSSFGDFLRKRKFDYNPPSFVSILGLKKIFSNLIVIFPYLRCLGACQNTMHTKTFSHHTSNTC